MENKTAFIFPAFITSFTHKEFGFLNQHQIDIHDYLKKISTSLEIDLPDFSDDSADYYSNELYAQLLAYSFSCSFNDILTKQGIIPQFVAGYSMGIYAALYAVKAYSFEEGARIIHKAYHLVNDLTLSHLYGMGAIIGLSFDDVSNVIINNKLDLEIININNEHSFVLAGKKNEIAIALNGASESGALNTTELSVNTPYHSKYLVKYAKKFEEVLNTISFENPTIPVISTYDQRKICTVLELKAELIFNLTRKINWHKTMQKLLENKVSEMYECGAGKDLKKISRFIHGDYHLKSVYKI